MNTDIQNNSAQMNVDTDRELLEMRKQLQSLQQQIDNATTLREDTLRKQLHQGNRSLINREIRGLVLVGFVTLFMPPMLYLNKFSLYFCAFTGLFFLFAFCWEIYYFRHLRLAHLMECDLLTSAKLLQEYKRLNRVWLFKVGLPFILIWFTWYVAEYIGTLGLMEGAIQWKFIIGIVLSLAMGGVIGGLIGYLCFYRPQMLLADKMLDEIHALEQDI